MNFYRKSILLVSFLSIYSISILLSPMSYASCGGLLKRWMWDWNLTGNCTISWGLYTVWWNINVWPYTLTVANNASLVTNLRDKKITFTSWKINLWTNGTVYGDRAEMIWYGEWSPAITNCPSGKKVWNPISKSTPTSVVNASTRGYIICK